MQQALSQDALIEGGGNRPLALDTGLAGYRIVEGYADIFVIDRQGEARRHLFRAEAGAVVIAALTIAATPSPGRSAGRVEVGADPV